MKHKAQPIRYTIIAPWPYMWSANGFSCDVYAKWRKSVFWFEGLDSDFVGRFPQHHLIIEETKILVNPSGFNGATAAFPYLVFLVNIES